MDLDLARDVLLAEAACRLDAFGLAEKLGRPIEHIWETVAALNALGLMDGAGITLDGLEFLDAVGTDAAWEAAKRKAGVDGGAR